MFEKVLKNKAFRLRLLTATLAALFIIPAYLFFSAPPQNVSAGEPLRFLAENKSFLKAPEEATLSEIKARSFPAAELSKQADLTAEKESISSLLSRLLRDYRTSELEPDRKLAIRTILPEINTSAEGRELIVSFFFHEQDPEMAASMYDMILDAKLKDASLITELIERDETEYSLDYKTRLIDLIADHNTIKQTHNQKIEDFLADMALHSDESVRLAAAAQWAWYVQHHKGILPVMDAYLFNHASQVRQEIYEMIELGTIQDEAEKSELALALDSLLYADYLELTAEERVRIHKLKAQLYP